MAEVKFDGQASVAEGFKLIKEKIYDKSYKHNGSVSWSDLKNNSNLSLQQGSYQVTGDSENGESGKPGILSVSQFEVLEGGVNVKYNIETYVPVVDSGHVFLRYRKEGSVDVPSFNPIITEELTYDGGRVYDSSVSLISQLTKFAGKKRLFFDSPLVVVNPGTIDLKELADFEENKEVRFIKFFNDDSMVDQPINFIDSSNTLKLRYPNGASFRGGQLSEARIIKKNDFATDEGVYICISNTGDGVVFVEAPTTIDVSRFADKETVAYRKTFDVGDVTFVAPGKTVVYTNKSVDETADKLSGKNGSAAIVTVFGNSVYIDIRNVK